MEHVKRHVRPRAEQADPDVRAKNRGSARRKTAGRIARGNNEIISGSSTSEFQFRSGLRVLLVASDEALIHPLVLSADRAYHEHQRSQQSDPRVLRGQYRHTIVQPLDALDRITLHCAIHSGGLAGIDGL